MRIKNTSAAILKFPEFDLILKPGDEADLSKFDPSLISNHPTLTSYFQKGILVNLGFAKTPGSKNRLNSARARIERLNMKDNFVVKEKDSSFEKKKDLSKKAERREVLKRTSLRGEIERYKSEFLQNKNPLDFNPEELEKPKPRVKIQKSTPNVSLGLDGHLHPEPLPGVIYPRDLVGETTLLAVENERKEKRAVKDSEVILDVNGESLALDIGKIKERFDSLCGSFQLNGSPCGKKRVKGYETCILHMTKAEKESYEEEKRIQKEKEQQRTKDN